MGTYPEAHIALIDHFNVQTNGLASVQLTPEWRKKSASTSCASRQRR